MDIVERRRIDGGQDQDVHTGWRKLLCYTQRAGVTARAKRRTRRRERREAKTQLRGARQWGES